MSSKISIGLAKKVGLPNYGSLAASCYVEVPAADDVLESQEVFDRRVRRAFAACLKAVEEQLASQQAVGPDVRRQVESKAEQPTRPTQSNGTGSGSSRPATSGQVRAVRALAARQRLNLTAFLRERHGVEAPEDLTIQKASATIDFLKERLATAS